LAFEVFVFATLGDDGRFLRLEESMLVVQ